MVTLDGRVVVSTVAGLLLLLCQTVKAQEILVGQTPFENLRTSRSPERTPGNMVGGGFARAQTAVLNPGGTVEITQQGRPTSVQTQFRIDAIATVLEDFFESLVYLLDRFFARAGLSTLFSFGDGADGTTGDGTDDTTGDSTEGAGTDDGSTSDDSTSGDRDTDRRPGGRSGRGR